MKQSALEVGRNDLKADYLAAIASLGVDVMYVLTGVRSPGVLSDEDNSLISATRRLPAKHRTALRLYLEALSGEETDS